MTLGFLAQVACILEATAKKPGNVHRTRDFVGDAHYLDFLLSAAAIVEPINRAPELGLGPTILAGVEATRAVVSTNTNLGILLLIAPVACIPVGKPIREGLAEILDTTTIDDARAVYRAIRVARPGGLGAVDDQDIASEPTITLREAMRLASDRDLIARQYANNYADIFEIVLPALTQSLSAGRGLESSIIEALVKTMAQFPDTLIARKRGQAIAEEASRRAADAIGSLDYDRFDAWLRADGHARNPGATADLIAAALFIALVDGTIRLPLPGDSWPFLDPIRRSPEGPKP